MEISTIVGWVFGGFMTRVYAAGAAVWAASQATAPLHAVAQAVASIQNLR